jgi:hypothetical protein
MMTRKKKIPSKYKMKTMASLQLKTLRLGLLTKRSKTTKTHTNNAAGRTTTGNKEANIREVNKTMIKIRSTSMTKRP